MDYYTPQNSSLADRANVSIKSSAALSSSAGFTYPDVGQKLLLMVFPYGGASIIDPENLISVGGGGKLLEVQVTAEKKVTINLV